MAGVLLPFLASKLGRYVAGALAVLALLGGVYMKGYGACAAKHKRAAARIEQEWQEKVTAAERIAYQNGLSAALAEAENEETVHDVENTAAAEAGSDDLCLSADVVERLRALH